MARRPNEADDAAKSLSFGPVRHRSRPPARTSPPDPVRQDDYTVEREVTETSAAKPTYEVGYGKPPKHSQFKPGQSGNPKGRNKGSKNDVTLLVQLLDEPVPIRIDGVEKKLPRRRVILLRAVKDAMEGKKDARDFVLRMAAAEEVASEHRAGGAPGQPVVTDAERDLLRFFERQLLEEAGVPADKIDTLLDGGEDEAEEK